MLFSPSRRENFWGLRGVPLYPFTWKWSRGPPVRPFIFFFRPTFVIILKLYIIKMCLLYRLGCNFFFPHGILHSARKKEFLSGRIGPLFPRIQVIKPDIFYKKLFKVLFLLSALFEKGFSPFPSSISTIQMVVKGEKKTSPLFASPSPRSATGGEGNPVRQRKIGEPATPTSGRVGAGFCFCVAPGLTRCDEPAVFDNQFRCQIH